jgi:hypothetical protein
MRSRRMALVLAAVLAAGASAAETLERVLAIVDERPVYLSDVRAVERLDHLGRNDARERVIDEMLLFREANRLPQVTTPVPEPEESGTEPVDEEARARAFARRAAIRRYAAFRFRPQVRLDDEAVRRAYRERWETKVDPPPFAAVSAELREQLIAQAVDRAMEAWVKDLRAAAHIRYNALD